MRVADRLNQYLERKNLSPYVFEKNCGISNGYISKQTKGKGTIGSKIVSKITARYKDLSVNWLMTGEGQMLTTTFYVPSEHVSTLAENEALYETHQNTIKTLKEKILILENVIADKEKIIQLLEKQVSGK
jgi:hypothetical protein